MILFRFYSYYALLLVCAVVQKSDWFVAGSTFAQQQKLVANDGASGVEFGSSVALDGDTVVVGAIEDIEDPARSGSGSVYVFVRSGTTWTQQQKLGPDDGTTDDEFGYTVAIDGDTLVVGGEGSVYVFVRSGTTWTQQQKLGPDDGTTDDEFGYTVALDGDTLVVGGEGSVYVFVRSGTTWTQQQKLVANDGESGWWFGKSVALDGDRLVVNDENSDLNGPGSGSVYMFIRSGTTWTQQQILIANDGGIGDFFGERAALDGDTAAFAAIEWGIGSISEGNVYVFALSSSSSECKNKCSSAAASILTGLLGLIFASTVAFAFV